MLGDFARFALGPSARRWGAESLCVGELERAYEKGKVRGEIFVSGASSVLYNAADCGGLKLSELSVFTVNG